jgi:hypothetical protein
MRRRDEAMRQRDDFYASAFAQQQAILQVSSLNYFIRYRSLSNTFKTDSTCATCTTNSAAIRNSNVIVSTFPTTTSLRVTSWSSGTVPIISLSVPSFSFILMFFNQCKFSIHPTMMVLDCFLCVVNFVMHGCVILCDAML